MAERFVVADLHMGHKGVTIFTGRNGGPLRPWDCPDEMDEAMIERWNAVVGPKDKVEVLGDVVINRRCLATLDRLNGKKRLRSGNHDIFTPKDYLKHFEDISAYKVFDDLIMSHIPIHEESLKQRWLANVHGHLHDGRVMMRNPAYDRFLYTPHLRECPPMEVVNPRYLCVSVEHTDFTPISMDEVYRRIREQQSEGQHEIQAA